ARKEAESSRLWLVDLTSQATRPIPGTELGQYPFWSSDSRSIGFANQDKGIVQKVPVEGGAPQRVAEGLRLRFRGGSWNRKGELVYAESEGPLQWIRSTGSAPHP